MHKTIERPSAVVLLVVAAAAAVSGLGAGPAMAAGSDTTTTTFAVDAGTLDIVAPASVAVGSGGAPGTVLNGSLGAVTVTDSRAAADASWLATVTSTNFVTGGATGPETTLASEVGYWSGAATAS